MTEAHKTPTSASSATASSLSYSVRRMRNTAVLVKWIEDHQSNPYPTKAEKQYLAYYSGMNLTQLSTWFANARRRIKKIGMKTWLEGRSTFSLEQVFPPTASFHQRSSTDFSAGGTYQGLPSTSPVAPAAAAYNPGLATGYSQQFPSALMGSTQLSNGLSYDSSLQPCTSTTSPLSSFYGMNSHSRMSVGMTAFGMGQWSTLPSTPVSFPSLQSRPSSGNAAPLHSPLTAQSIDVGDTTYSSLTQHSPEQMLPECASSEPSDYGEGYHIKQDTSYKVLSNQSSLKNSQN